MGKRQTSAARIVVETVALVVVAVLVAVLVKTLFVQSFYIPSGSMEPGFQVNDRIVVEKPSYWSGGPERGDVVVFSDPGGWLSAAESDTAHGFDALLAKVGLLPTGGHLVKRVIGLPGDEIVCCDQDGRLTVDGQALDESAYIAPQTGCAGPMAGCDGWRVTVPEDAYFVMGDNRSASADSSYHLAQECASSPNGADGTCTPEEAFVKRDLIVGKVVAIMWPWSHKRWIG